MGKAADERECLAESNYEPKKVENDPSVFVCRAAARTKKEFFAVFEYFRYLLP